MGLDVTLCAPEGYFPPQKLVEECRSIASSTGAKITLSSDPESAVKDADVIYTDVWVSMGESESVWKERIEKLTPYRVTTSLMAKACPECIFMHCLPAFHDTETTTGKEIEKKYGLREMEVENAVFESSHSVVFDEAENRMHTIKAVMLATL